MQRPGRDVGIVLAAAGAARRGGRAAAHGSPCMHSRILSCFLRQEGLKHVLVLVPPRHCVDAICEPPRACTTQRGI